MFVAEDMRLPLDVDAARARLLAFLSIGGLQESSEDASEVGRDLLLRAGVGAFSKQMLVQLLRPYQHDGVVVIPVRWVATGASGAMFPQLDGNLELAPVDATQSELRLKGAYRPPLAAVGGGLDRMLLHRVADATIRRFLQDIADGLMAVPDADTHTAAAPYEPAWGET
jgi:hypothetical protein